MAKCGASDLVGLCYSKGAYDLVEVPPTGQGRLWSPSLLSRTRGQMPPGAKNGYHCPGQEAPSRQGPPILARAPYSYRTLLEGPLLSWIDLLFARDAFA